MIRLVDSKVGRILVNDKDQYLSRSFIEYGEFSQGEVDLFEFAIQPEAVVADIGANFGAHTLVFAKRARHVYAFEPQRMVFNALCGTLALNNLTNVTAVNAAVGAEQGSLGCLDLDPEIDNNFGGLSFSEISPELATYEVPVIPFLDPVNFMKIDVEGMEKEVLKGSAPMIQMCKPVIYVENDRKAKSEELIETLRALGYSCYWHITTLYNPDNYFKNSVDVFPGLSSINMLCLPESVEIQGLERVTTPFHPFYTYAQ